MKNELRLTVVLLLGVLVQFCSAQDNNICRLPKKVGVCKAAFPRFFYDINSQSCVAFTYGGCQNNANNFKTREECEATCNGTTGPTENGVAVEMRKMGPTENDVAVEMRKMELTAEEYSEMCLAEPTAGPCRASFLRFYYTRESGECKSFVYGGCQGNKNNYDTKESCEGVCRVSVMPSSKNLLDDFSAEYRDHCMAAPLAGPCRAAFLSYHFDHDTGSCQSFLYGGCQGNANRYNTVEECMTQCGRDGIFHTRNLTRNRWTAGFFLFTTLAAISGLLLVTLILVSLRRRRLSRRSSMSDKEELLPDEQSSVESLTFPPSPKRDEA